MVLQGQQKLQTPGTPDKRLAEIPNQRGSMAVSPGWTFLGERAPFFLWLNWMSPTGISGKGITRTTPFPSDDLPLPENVGIRH